MDNVSAYKNTLNSKSVYYFSYGAPFAKSVHVFFCRQNVVGFFYGSLSLLMLRLSLQLLVYLRTYMCMYVRFGHDLCTDILVGTYVYAYICTHTHVLVNGAFTNMCVFVHEEMFHLSQSSLCVCICIMCK